MKPLKFYDLSIRSKKWCNDNGLHSDVAIPERHILTNHYRCPPKIANELIRIKKQSPINWPEEQSCEVLDWPEEVEDFHPPEFGKYDH